MMIATGIADRQIRRWRTHLEEGCARPASTACRSRAPAADWVLIDAGDIVIHLFKPEARALYALEKMWGAELDAGAE